jgi:hypothetical protein
MKYRLNAVILAVLLVLSTSGCAGMGGEFTVSAEKTVVEEGIADRSFSGFQIAETDNGYYYVAKFSVDDSLVEGNEIGFADEGGIRRRKTVYEIEGFNYRRLYYGIWYDDGKIVTAYSPQTWNLIPNESIPLYFDEYDENFNLIRTVSPGNIVQAVLESDVQFNPSPSLMSIYLESVAFDGEYFYYFFDNPEFGPEIAEPNSDMRVYRLNRDFEVVDSVNPSDSRINASGILKLVKAADGKVYIIYFENGYFGTSIKMKAYGENEKAVKIKGIAEPERAIEQAIEFAGYGDARFITYYSSVDGLIYGVLPNGSTVLYDWEQYNGTGLNVPSALLSGSVASDGTRISLATNYNFDNQTNSISLIEITID